jgi:hypothetical protein
MVAKGADRRRMAHSDELDRKMIQLMARDMGLFAKSVGEEEGPLGEREGRYVVVSTLFIGTGLDDIS